MARKLNRNDEENPDLAQLIEEGAGESPATATAGPLDPPPPVQKPPERKPATAAPPVYELPPGIEAAPREIYPGAPCPEPKCRGVLRVLSSVTVGTKPKYRVRCLICNTCRVCPPKNKHITRV